MSVINKMLRDLDARRVMLPGMPAESALRLSTPRWGHAPELPQLERPRPWFWIAGFVLLGLAAGAGYLSSRLYPLDEEQHRPPHSTIVVTSDPAFVASPLPVAEPAVNLPASATAPVVIAATVTPQAPAVTQLVVSAPVASTSVPAVMPVPTATVQAAVQKPAPPPAAPKVIQAAPAPVLPMPVAQTPAVSPVAPKPMPGPAQAAIAPASQLPVIAATANKPAPVALPSVPAQTASEKVIPVPPAKVQTPPVPVVQPNRQAATQEALAQAQGLWNTGSRDAAVNLMREAVAATERAYNAGTLSADSPVLVSLVRELTRMELTEGRPQRVLELLIHLEPALGKQADLWAVRGNAAQRLSRHQESVISYSKALAIRPDEPRWMLASAVSLAALGRLDESAVLADKANAAGVVSPEILAYLKQIGVPVKPN